MMREWLLQMAVNGVLTGAGWLLCLYLFLGLKRELRRSGEQTCRLRQALEDDLEALRRDIGRLDAELRETTRRAELLVEPPPAASGVNLTRRGQALRMHRRGEAPGNIAAALGIPQLEVELLLKVEQIEAGNQ